MTKHLPTNQLHHRTIARAAQQAIENAERLLVMGYGQVALETLSLLLEDGPWRVPDHGAVVQRLQSVLPVLCWVNQTPCPAIGDNPSYDVDALATWARQWNEDILEMRLMVSSLQQGVAGEDWTDEYLSNLKSMRVDADGQNADYARFSSDLQLVLQHRLHFKCGRRGKDALTSLAKALTPFRTDAEIRVAGQVDGYTTRELVDVMVGEIDQEEIRK